MKLLQSPSISSSTSSTFDPQICASKSVTTGCFSSILRRFLCSGSLPTHPSDQISKISTNSPSNPSNIDRTPLETPGIVARLMGLETFSENFSSMSRSQSLNSVEFNTDNEQKKVQKHRRVKSSISVSEISEMPDFLEKENEEFFVINFDKFRGNKKENRSKGRKSEVGTREFKEKRNKKCKKREKTSENEEIINKMVLRVLKEEQLINRISDEETVNCNKDLNGEFGIEEVKQSDEYRIMCRKDATDNGSVKVIRKKKIRNRREMEEWSSEDSSPVSVLDFDQFIFDPECPESEEHTNTRSKLPSRRLDDEGYSDNNNSIKEENKKKNLKRKTKMRNSQNELNLWAEICRLAEEEEVMESKIWVYKRKEFKDFEEISLEFELQIFNELLDQLIVQLC